MLIPLSLPPADAWDWPVAVPEVAGAFRSPSSQWGPGHRGIDLEASPGAQVSAVADGRVTFVGRIAGVPTISVDHGAIRSTYQPVVATVAEGDLVSAGEPIGRVDGRLAHCPATCLHLGAKASAGYLDPVALILGGRVVLKPVDGPA